MTFSFERARQSLRLLLRHKRFTTLAILSLGIAIALNTTMYSVLDTIIDPKLAMREPDRLYTLNYFGNYRRQIPESEVEDMIGALTFADGITGMTQSGDARVVERGDIIREARIVTVMPNYFQVLGVQASHGRLPTENELDAGKPAVLSDRLYKQLFPDQKHFVEAPVVVAGETFTMVGTLAYESDFPGANTDLWRMAKRPADGSFGYTHIRLRSDRTLEQAGAELEALRLKFAARTGEWRKGDAGFRMWSATKAPFRVNNFHWALTGSVIAVLLIACANLANLQLARGVSRARELATRSAVGASRTDIITQLCVESGWLALGGLIVGGLLTLWAIAIVTASVPPVVSDYVTHPQVSWRVFAFAIGVMLVCLALVGLLPALKLSRVDVNELLKSGAGTGKSKSARRQYGALVVAEVALALSVLSSGSLILKATMTVYARRAGFDSEGMVTSYVMLGAGPNEKRTRQQRMDEYITLAKQAPSVVSAATSLSGAPETRYVSWEDPGGAQIEKRVPPDWGYRIVSADYMRAMRFSVVQGRDFSENESAEPVAIIDQPTARYFWPGGNPIGRLIKLEKASDKAPWIRVIGVVPQLRYSVGPADRGAPENASGLGSIYVLHALDSTRVVLGKNRIYGGYFSLIARGTGNPLKIPLAVYRQIGPGGGRRAYVGYPKTWEQMTGRDKQLARTGFMATLFMVFGVSALALAALGVYAIIAHMVAQRTREFGVRIAIGAGTKDIGTLVMREGNVLTLAGIAGGLLITWYTAGFVRQFVLGDYERYDSRVFAIVSIVLFLTAWLASYLPARRAMRINPVEALRND